ncbi:MAG: hypothetical protein QXN78_04955 [Conexivisphaerales archaeon]
MLVYLTPQIYIDPPWQIGIGKNIMKSLSTFDIFVNADLLINWAEEDECRKEGKALCLL